MTCVSHCGLGVCMWRRHWRVWSCYWPRGIVTKSTRKSKYTATDCPWLNSTAKKDNEICNGKPLCKLICHSDLVVDGFYDFCFFPHILDFTFSFLARRWRKSCLFFPSADGWLRQGISKNQKYSLLMHSCFLTGRCVGNWIVGWGNSGGSPRYLTITKRSDKNRARAPTVFINKIFEK